MPAGMALVPPNVASLTPYVPGKPIEEVERELGISGVAKLASNENALGPSPQAMEAARKAAAGVHLYPDGSAWALRQGLAAKLGVPFEETFVGNGSNELIELLVRTFTCDGEEVLTSAQSFVAYRLAAQAHGRLARRGAHEGALPLRPGGHPGPHHARTPRSSSWPTRTTRPAPGSPSRSWSRSWSRCRTTTLVVLDEAYQEFVDAPGYPRSLELRKRFPNLVVLRTFSKIYGLAGLRLGYGVARPELVGYLDRVRAPFNTNLVAQAAGLAALDDHEHVRPEPGPGPGGAAAAPGRAGGARRHGGPVARATSSWPTSRAAAAQALFEKLLREGVVLRPVAGYGFPQRHPHHRGAAAPRTSAAWPRSKKVLGR